MSITTAAEKPPRKFPPPCWTQDEALALIEAYKERWYALRRGYLRTPDWEAVAASIGRSFPNASPAKTSAQCRHKMEKLRQRYRAEKQRALSYPGGRFLSSWFFFESMDAMDNGGEIGDQVNSGGNGFLVKTLIDQNSSQLPSGFNSKNRQNIVGGMNPNIGPDHETLDHNSVPLRFRTKNSSNGKSRVSNVHSSYLDYGSDEDDDEDGGGYGIGFQGKTPIDPNSGPFRAKKFGKIYGDGDDLGSGFRAKTPIDQDFGSRARKFCKIEGKLNPNFGWGDDGYNGVDANGEYWVKVPSEMNSVPLGLRGKNSGKIDRNLNSNPNLDPRVSNSNGFSSGGGRVKRERGGGGGGPVAEMVSSIRVLGEGFMKMEKMKMEMAKEIEKMRIEMEMKRNTLFLESQHQIVDSFVKGLIEKKKMKKKAKETESVDS